MNSKYKHFSWLIGLLGWSLCRDERSAQNQRHNPGIVTGDNGAPIPTRRSWRSTGSGATRNALSNDAGGYTLVGLTPGTYQVTVRRIGAAPQNRTIVVQIGATQIQDFTLASQAALLETQVITAASGVETHTSEVATNVTQAQINKLPTPSRNFLDLAQLAPGVQVTEDRVNGQFRTVTAGGQPPSATFHRRHELQE
jgi:hypothetical protein